MISEIAQGLTTAEAATRRVRDGANSLSSEHVSAYQRYGRYVVGPIPLMLLAAIVLSLLSGKVSDALVILALFLTNVAIQAWHEHKADSATKNLAAKLASQAHVLRDGRWQDISSEELVVGDVIELSVGAVVPADIRIDDARNLSINESSVTGESLPKEKQVSEVAYAGSFVLTGRAQGEVVATGMHTYFGDALRAASQVQKRSALETDILVIARYLSLASVAAIIVITAALYLRHAPVLDIATLDLSLLIAGIPVALPTVMSLIISVGVFDLSKRHAVVRRLSALEDFANVSMLLSDKTGTLTENALRVHAIDTFGDFSTAEALAYAYACAANDGHNPIDQAIEKRALEAGVQALTLVDFIPGDSERKRSTAIIEKQGVRRLISLGSPHIIASLADISATDRARFDQLVSAAASRGERVLALAAGEGKEEHLRLIAVMSLSDRLRADVPAVLAFLREHGVRVKMLTGDAYEIAADIAKTLGLTGEMLHRDVFDTPQSLAASFDGAAGFAEMLPKDKLLAVEEAKKRYTVAVTGDGVNDVPMVRAADVGIAVHNAVDALRETADIVLLNDGLQVITDAIVEARKVFARLYHYSTFRISESFRIIVTIAVIGLILGTYPLTPVQLILLALLNDIPVVSIAFDRVKIARAPAQIDVRGRFILSTLFGLTGVGNSLLMLWLCMAFLHLSWPMIQTIFFLKLVVSGHMLLYVAHTDERWWRFLPSKQVVLSISATQCFATILALGGIFTAAISWKLALLVWVWSFAWMQLSEVCKVLMQKNDRHQLPVVRAA